MTGAGARRYALAELSWLSHFTANISKVFCGKYIQGEFFFPEICVAFVVSSDRINVCKCKCVVVASLIGSYTI